MIGVASSGIHSNGYSLVRKVVFENANLGVDDVVDELGGTVGEVLLTPTRIYARAVRKVLEYYRVKRIVHGIAHITGGGLDENVARILPPGVAAKVDADSWEVPAVFPWLQRLGNIDDEEMKSVFNLGIGLVLIVSEYYVRNICQLLADINLQSWQIGTIVEKN